VEEVTGEVGQAADVGAAQVRGCCFSPDACSYFFGISFDVC